MMKKIMTGVAAAAIAGSALAIPTQANALAEWVIPTIIATGIGGVMVGSTAANGPYYGYSEPGALCHAGREQGPDGRWHRVRVCPY
ncbi:MAG TPA: hypothetical protein VNQ34_01785 [Xanthobacteraceae bacterium]|nr:hypothetical protein [Xanthobacteraceae bacterium]